MELWNEHDWFWNGFVSYSWKIAYEKWILISLLTWWRFDHVMFLEESLIFYMIVMEFYKVWWWFMIYECIWYALDGICIAILFTMELHEIHDDMTMTWSWTWKEWKDINDFCKVEHHMGRYREDEADKDHTCAWIENWRMP